jgi:hypothetical protein
MKVRIWIFSIRKIQTLLIIDFDAIDQPNNDQFVHHLHALQYRLGIKGIEVDD